MLYLRYKTRENMNKPTKKQTKTTKKAKTKSVRSFFKGILNAFNKWLDS